MSALSESISQRITLGYLHSHYGLELDPAFAQDVTVTSIADDILSVRPGSLYLPCVGIDSKVSEESQLAALEGPSRAIDDDTESEQSEQLSEVDQAESESEPSHVNNLPLLIKQAELRGAYGVVLPSSARKEHLQAGIPLLYGDLEPDALGQILSNAAGDPSSSLAVFVLAGEDVSQEAADLAHFLHTLGNPVGLLSAGNITSLDRPLDVEKPLSMFDVQRALSISLEDGTAAVVIGADPQTLQHQALCNVQIDVLSFPTASAEHANKSPSRFHEGRKGQLNAAAQRYGFAVGSQMQVARISDSSDEMARQALGSADQARIDRLSLNIAMTVAAGVKRSHIRSALEASQELA
ncbi:hypothetical protein KIMH_05020 [Bombiscardovia apis]|uniref:UDP-N-acetylmuramyl peptide synthase n=1 Tax=Bombiscardovia apis TaxID=2932182 RepID=A0ABM8BBW9_9BIFI|nr:hypothetical protein [Bombiscardovia apis]BDR54391.1 hypothetical protein KIMH_05020 [Bombiscardovia apis]